MKPETPDCSVTSMAKARIPLGMLATSPGGVPLGPSFFSITTSPSSSVVLTQRSSTSLGEENAPTGTADFAIRITLTASGLSDLLLLEVAGGDQDVLGLLGLGRLLGQHLPGHEHRHQAEGDRQAQHHQRLAVHDTCLFHAWPVARG